MDNDITRNYLLDLGLNQEEIDSLTPEHAICYIKFHSERKFKTASIIFIGFSDEDTTSLWNKARTAGLSVYSNIGRTVTFICAAETADDIRILKAKEYEAKLLSKTEFETLCIHVDYNLSNCALIYDTSIPVELRIAKPLSDFDKNVEIDSFTSNSNEQYSVNIYNMTCSCYDFKKKIRSQFSKGDLRRFCKHLIHEYKLNFGLTEAGNFQKFIFENGRALYTQFDYFTLEKLPTPVMVNFETKDDWWIIFIENEKGIYKRYSYSPIDERFFFGEGPRGLTVLVRQKLKELTKKLNGTSNSQSKTTKSNASPQTSKSNGHASHQKIARQRNTKQPQKGGCAAVFILPVIVILYFLLA